MAGIEEKKEAFLYNWLAGTTCHSRSDTKIIWTSSCEKYVIAKHTGHMEYCGRAYGNLYCETYYSLYKLDAPVEHLLRDLDKHYILQWKGRWSKAKEYEAEEMIKKYY